MKIIEYIKNIPNKHRLVELLASEDVFEDLYEDRFENLSNARLLKIFARINDSMREIELKRFSSDPRVFTDNDEVLYMALQEEQKEVYYILAERNCYDDE